MEMEKWAEIAMDLHFSISYIKQKRVLVLTKTKTFSAKPLGF